MDVPIRPHVGVFALFSAIDYKAWYALAEFVDNSLQSWLSVQARLPGEMLKIEISTGRPGAGPITIRDNAGGIPESRYIEAFQPAQPPPDPSGLSVYGIGMKSAAAWFGKRFHVRSSALGEQVIRTIEFDFREIVDERRENIPVQLERAPSELHFTEVILDDLYHPIQTSTHAKVKSHLASIYRSFLRRDDIAIVYDGEELQFAQPDPLVAPAAYEGGPSVDTRWYKSIDIQLDEEQSIIGFAGIRARADTKAPGFALLRQDRVITGLEDDPWRPREIFGPANKYRAQRLFGELTLCGVKVSYSKNAFVWGDIEEEVIRRLKSVLDAEPLCLLKQADLYRVREAPEGLDSAARRALAPAGRAITAAGSAVLPGQLAADPAPAVPESLNDDATPMRERELIIPFRGNRWTVRLQLVQELDDRWLEVSDRPGPDDAHRVEVRISTLHPFMQRFVGTDASDLDGTIRLAACLALAETTARLEGVSMAQTVRRNLNQLLLAVAEGDRV